MQNGVEVLLRPDVTVTADGQVQSFTNTLGEPVYPLLFRECVYLPIRSVAELLGKRVTWVPVAHYGYGAVHLYNSPTQEQLTEANAYLSAVRSHLNAVRTLLAETYAVQSDEEFVSHMETVRADLTAILDLPAPTFQALSQEVEWLQDHAQLVLSKYVDLYLPEGELPGAAGDQGADYHAFWAQTPQRKWMDMRQAFVSVLQEQTTYFIQLEEICTCSEALLSAIRQDFAGEVLVP